MFRLGQRVCRVGVRSGEPYVEVAVVCRVTKQTFDVSGKDAEGDFVIKSLRYGYDWFADWKSAITAAYLTLLSIKGNVFQAKEADKWSARKLVKEICKVRRLERRIMSRRKRGSRA